MLGMSATSSHQPTAAASAAQNTLHEQIAANLAAVHARMAAAATRAGRAPASVALVAVSKTHPLEAIAAAVAGGQLDFGENRFDELWEKVAAAEAAGLSAVRWHFIGAIQSRQTARAVGPFALIHAVDRTKIARRLSRDAEEAGHRMPVLLEVNVSGEESKHGFAPDELRGAFAETVALPGIDVQGLMTMAPFVDDAEEARPVFRGLAALRDELAAAHGCALPHLSMGMSNDYEVAIEEGATIIRVGTAIFGTREAPHATPSA
jgi:pyridoxal phosphate enzyme (YggS family)